MEDKFEHQIADQVSGFQLTPNAQVWKGVALELDKEKNNKRGLFWWIPLGLLCFGLAGWYLFTTTQAPLMPSSQVDQKNAKKELSNRSISSKDSIAIVNQTTKPNHQNQGSKEATQNIAVEQSSNALLVQQPEQQQSSTRLATITTIDSPKVFKETTHTVTNNNPNNQITIDKQENNQISQTIIQENPTKKDSNISSLPTTSILTKKPIKSSWRLQLALGSTRLSESSILGNSTATDRAAFANNSSAIVSGLPNTTTIAASNKGFHAELGVSKQWQLSKRWEFTAGLSYRYLQNQQMTGLKKDSSYLISGQASSNNKAVTVNNYYLAGNQNNLTNKAHWLMLPIQIHFNLNPSSKLNWLLYGGTNLSWNFTSNWLLPDQANNILYEARPLTNIFGMHLKWGIQIRNQQEQSLSLGWEKSMNSMSKLIQSKQYWNQLQLQYSQPIYLKKSIKK